MPEGSHIPGESGNGRRSDNNPNDAESNGEAVRIAENRMPSPGATQGIDGSGGGGGDGGGRSVVDDKWDSPLHRTHLDLGLKLDNGETYPIGIDYTFRFTINSQTVPPIDLEDLTRPLSNFPRGSDPPGKLYQRGEQRQIQRGITGTLGLVNTGPTATTTFSYNQNNTTTLGATDSKVMPKCLVDSEIGDKWDADNKSYSSFNIAYPAQYIRLNEEQSDCPLEVKVGMGINLNPAGSEKPLPQISFVNRHQILVWVSDPMSRSPIRGIVVLISSYLDNIRTEDGLSIHEQEDVRLGTGSLPQTKKEEHEPGTISLSVAQVRKPGAPGSDNLRPRITAFFTKLAQRSVVPSMEYIPRHEYLARGWDGNSNKWRSVLWPALDEDFRAADPEETSAIWRIKCPWSAN
ncbi:hypothetical protein B0H14DRAFT_2800517 [Mycena olivaceomarginata]|nr:hypothetical protein B0H14DRAFT_2800517 [Mycena olivaceomarginata]